MALVKNWKFGTNGTIKNYADMSENFFYHDQFGTIGNGTNYGAVTVSPDAANALNGQPIEGINSPPVREFTADSLKTYLTGLNGSTLVDPKMHNAGNGSFMGKWKLPKGGSLLGQDIVWETRVRMKTPKYFWFAIWTAGNKWMWRDNSAQGAEHDIVESFGYDNGGGEQYTNFDGRYWHVGTVANPGKDTIVYEDWSRTMGLRGFTKFDATQYHTWTWLYRKDNSYTIYCDGVPVQSGLDYHWTYGAKAEDEPIDMVFLFDGGWGHTQIGSVNKTLPTSDFAGKFYEWNYSRVYLSDPAVKVAVTPFKTAQALPGTIQAEDFDKGGQTFASYYLPNANSKNTYRPQEIVGLAPTKDAGGGFAVTNAQLGQYLKYTVNVAKAGTYQAAFRVSSDVDGGLFHLENAKGVNLTGGILVPNTKSAQSWTTINGTITLPAGSQTLTLVQEAPGFNLNWMSLGKMLPASTIPEGPYKLINKGNTDSLDVGAQRVENNSGVGSYKYVGNRNQQWILHSLGDGKYQIVGVASGRALGVSDAGGAVISNYQSLPSQQWTLVASGTGYKFKNVGNNRLLEASGQFTDDADKPSQIWDISPA